VGRQRETGSVLHRARILAPDIPRGQLYVKHGGVYVSMSHQFLEGGQRDPVANHIGSKGMSKAVRIGAEDVTAQTVMPKKRAEPRDAQGLSAVAAFQGNKQCR
jgi:hypothetical protein